MKTLLKHLTTAAVIMLTVLNVQAQNFSAEKIMKKNDLLLSPKDAYSEITLTLTDKNNHKVLRKLISYSKKTALGYNSYFEVTAPADIAGMKLLSIAQKGEDDQRMYLPAFGKIRKISSSGKTGKFLGSDIYFYDLEDHDFDDFTYKAIGTENWNGKKYYVIASIPKDKKAPYSKIINYVNADDYFIYKSEMYDKRGQLLKRLIVNKTKIIKNIIVPVEMTYTNVKTKHSTHYQIDVIKINSGVSDDIFNVKNLEE